MITISTHTRLHRPHSQRCLAVVKPYHTSSHEDLQDRGGAHVMSGYLGPEASAGTEQLTDQNNVDKRQAVFVRTGNGRIVHKDFPYLPVGLASICVKGKQYCSEPNIPSCIHDLVEIGATRQVTKDKQHNDDVGGDVTFGNSESQTSHARKCEQYTESSSETTPVDQTENTSTDNNVTSVKQRVIASRQDGACISPHNAEHLTLEQTENEYSYSKTTNSEADALKDDKSKSDVVNVAEDYEKDTKNTWVIIDNVVNISSDARDSISTDSDISLRDYTDSDSDSSDDNISESGEDEDEEDDDTDNDDCGGDGSFLFRFAKSVKTKLTEERNSSQ